jgi:hypothetical protein
VPATTELSAQFDTSHYLSPHSDSVSLLVLAHQTHMHNLLTQAASETRSALLQEQAIRLALGRDGGAGDLAGMAHLASTLTRLRSACEPVVQCMLFAGEAPLNGPLSGSTDFARHFQQAGPFDRAGRSLRQFDLKNRIFRYPCSYLIYSSQFDALPVEAKAYIYRRMWKILTGRDSSRAFAKLADADREAICQILGETKKDLPSYWKADSGR